MTAIQRRKTAIVAGLTLWMIVAPGCSWCQSVGDYYSSSQWYEDLGDAAVVTFGVGVLVVVGAGIVFLSGLEGVDLRGLNYQPGYSSGGHRSGYSYSDYYRTMSR